MDFVLSLYFPAGNQRAILHLARRGTHVATSDHRITLAEIRDEVIAVAVLRKLERLAVTPAFKELKPSSNRRQLEDDLRRHARGFTGVTVIAQPPPVEVQTQHWLEHEAHF